MFGMISKKISMGGTVNPTNITDSIAMLKRVTAGDTYQQIGDEYGLSQTAVLYRVRLVARDLQAIVGVIGVGDNDVPTTQLLRANGSAYLEALEHYAPDKAYQARLRKGPVPDDQINTLLQAVGQHSRNPKRDAALLMILFSTAAKPLEIARLEVRDYLNADGSIRELSMIRSDIAISGKERPVYFCSAAVNTCIDAYLSERIAMRHGMWRESYYRGLAPTSKLFLRSDGEQMRVIEKATTAGKQYLCSDILLAYKRIFSFAPTVGTSALSARRTIAQKLGNRGVASRQIGVLLGLSEPAAVNRLLQAMDRAPQSTNAVRHLRASGPGH